MKQSHVVLLIVGILLVVFGVIGLTITTNKLAFYNDCSVSPANSYSCDINSNSGAMNDYNSNMAVEAVSGIVAVMGFILSMGAFLYRPPQIQGA